MKEDRSEGKGEEREEKRRTKEGRQGWKERRRERKGERKRGNELTHYPHRAHEYSEHRDIMFRFTENRKKNTT